MIETIILAVVLLILGLQFMQFEGKLGLFLSGAAIILSIFIGVQALFELLFK